MVGLKKKKNQHKMMTYVEISPQMATSELQLGMQKKKKKKKKKETQKKKKEEEAEEEQEEKNEQLASLS